MFLGAAGRAPADKKVSDWEEFDLGDLLRGEVSEEERSKFDPDDALSICSNC